MAPKPELQDNDIGDIGELWRRYTRIEDRDVHADLILALICKFIVQQARNIPYGDWQERLSHPLKTYGISVAEWEAQGG